MHGKSPVFANHTMDDINIKCSFFSISIEGPSHPPPGKFTYQGIAHTAAHHWPLDLDGFQLLALHAVPGQRGRCASRDPVKRDSKQPTPGPT